MKHLFFLLLLLTSTACTYQTIEAPEDPAMLGDKRLLDKDKRQAALIGKQVQVLPNLATGTEPIVHGVSIFTQDVPLIQTFAENIGEPEDCTILIDANPMDPVPFSLLHTVRMMPQAVLDFGSGTARFGQNSSAVGSVGGPLASQLVFDVGLGTAVVVPASFVDLVFRYQAFSNAPWAAGEVVGPNLLVNVSIGYGDKNNRGVVTRTDVPVNLAAAGLGIIHYPRAKFGTSLEVTWNNYSGGGAATPLGVNFYSEWSGSIILQMQVAANTLPPPVIPWPNGADGVTLQNLDPAITMFQVQAKQYLSL
jgi:hypothetical protein